MMLAIENRDLLQDTNKKHANAGSLVSEIHASTNNQNQEMFFRKYKQTISSRGRIYASATNYHENKLPKQ